MSISYELLEAVAYELNRRAAIAVPLDAKQAFARAAAAERHPPARQALLSVVQNADVAAAQQSAMCGDTGLPRFYVKAGNDVRLDCGFAGLERALRQATARATQDVPLRSNRVHPLTRRNPGTNVGVMAPNVDFRFEPQGDWIDLTAVHKGGLFGTDYRMLFPGDGLPGIKRFFVDTIVAFGHRGLSCPPVIVGVGIGGTKDQCVTLSKEAACLRLVGDRHPDPLVADLEEELLALGNRTMVGIMGFRSDTPVLDVHCEVAYTHTGGLPVGISELCHAVRRATARIHGDGRVEYREDPQWFTAYARREGIDLLPDEPPPSSKGGEGMKGLSLGPGVHTGAGRSIPLIEVHSPSGAASAAPPAPQRPATPPLPGPSRREARAFHLTVPLSEEDVRRLRAGDVVYLSGCIFTARDGVYKHMLDDGHQPPIDIRGTYNVTAQSSPAGAEVAPGRYRVNSLQATAGFRYAQWMERLLSGYGVRAVINKGGMSPALYREVFKKYGAVCLSTMPYGIGAIYGRAVTGVRDVVWKEELGLSEAMWLLEVEELGPLLVDGDAEGRSYAAEHAAEVDAPVLELYESLPQLILKRFGEVTDPTAELIS
ncbi:MAG TPA: fumarate hydratase [Chloroflexota bacterium]|nr:fumarate hydratase [Chloroflexota bacterium]